MTWKYHSGKRVFVGCIVVTLEIPHGASLFDKLGAGLIVMRAIMAHFLDI
jgi:hypothetical protein